VITVGSIELLNRLIDRDIPLEKGKDRYDWTLVHYAAVQENPDMLTYLVK
jgi:hypothetical protein